MSGEDLDGAAEAGHVEHSRWRRKRVLAPALVLAVLALALAAAWLSRERIAGNLIARQLDGFGIPATYRIERIGGRRQIIRDLVVGDPARPDLTAERVELRLAYRVGAPRIGRITLTRPRLYGRLVGGRVSFGSLDRVIYRDTGRPPGLPELDLAIRDGRALIRTPHGPVGAMVEGEGLVSDGFAGTAALAAPRLVVGGCRLDAPSLFGRITTKDGAPRFAGPLRLASLACPKQEIALGRADAELELGADAQLSALDFRAALAAGPLRYAALTASGTDLTLRGRWKNGLLDERHTIALRGLSTPQVGAALVTLEGSLRAGAGFARLDFDSSVQGNGLRPGPALRRSLASLGRSGEGTMLAPVARRLAGALADQARGSALAGDLVIRRRRGVTTVMVPQAELRGGTGARIASLSRVEALLGPAPRISGNLATGGPGLPRISGRMERAATGDRVLRLAMEPYAAEGASIAIPQMSLAQGPNGAIGFSGRVVASGPLPGGSAEGLSVPFSGRWAPGGALALWRECVDIAFDRLRLASLALQTRQLRLCPARGRAIVEGLGGGRLRIAAGSPGLALAGTLGGTPIRLSSGPIGFAYPGTLAARRLAVALGPPATASRFVLSDLKARLGERDIAGTFDGAEVRLNAVPLDLREASGRWRYAGGALTLADASFLLVDRAQDARFAPLASRGAGLTLRDNVIRAAATLRNPGTDRVITEVELAHDLALGRGHADLSAPGVTFDRRLQPDALSRRALGVIANTRGTVTGTGRIEWGPGGVTSTGAFSSDGLDFAAAFGPVRGARGTVRFTDLIGLTTAPAQTIQVASVNPGVEVIDGAISFQLRDGRLLAVEGGSWPFMGGRLVMKSVDLNLGVREARRYEFAIIGLDAAAFVARFELPNIAATGTFDGTVPIVFDAQGNGRVEGGLLTSRPPGGNVSYIGDLTYRDLSPIANFVFDALRSLDYERMRIAMNGSLTGEIVTNVTIEQVKQGRGARRNIVTRALGNLPIQFRINVRAPFYQLITSFKSLRDPALVRDPRDLGLLSDDGTRFLRPEVRGVEAPPKVEPEDIVPVDRPVQN
jgi:hypothetical protein